MQLELGNLNIDAGATILVVDDVELNRVFLAAHLKKMGYKVIQASSGKMALELFDSQQPDLILMDICMPGMNGYEVVREIRHRSTEWLPIIFVSALTDEQSVVEAMRVGGDDYLFKPVNTEMLYTKIETQLMFRDSARQKEQLEKYKVQSTEEQNTLECFLQNFCTFDNELDPLVRSQLPETGSGMMALVARTPDKRMHVLWAKNACDNLQAALTVVTLAQTFYRMTAQGRNISAIVAEINGRLQDCLKPAHFVPAAMLSLDVEHRTIQIWNGGCQPVFLLDADNKTVLNSFVSQHKSLGELKQDEFDRSVECHFYGEGPVRLWLDAGVAGEVEGEVRLDLPALLRKADETGEADLFDFVLAERRAAGKIDNMALMVVNCPVPEEKKLTASS